MTAAKGQGAETTQRAIGCPGAARLPMLYLDAHARQAGIQYAAMDRLRHWRLWTPGLPPSPVTTEKGMTHVPQHESSFSRRIAPEFWIERSLRKTRGRRECRVKASPMARLQNKKQAGHG
jgi:hypothetical protein